MSNWLREINSHLIRSQCERDHRAGASVQEDTLCCTHLKRGSKISFILIHYELYATNFVLNA